MAVRLYNSQFNYDDNIQVSFQGPLPDIYGDITVSLDRDETSGHYEAEFRIVSPAPGRAGIVHESRDEILRLLSNEQLLLTGIYLATRDARKAKGIAEPFMRYGQEMI